MDVILDTNQYWPDPKMERPGFQLLFDYLRVTGGSLVVPRIVRDEVLAKCRVELEAEHSRTVTSLRELRKRAFKLDVPKDPSDLDHPEELRLLEEKLKAPGAGVNSVVLPDYSDIDIGEVAKRGIQRIKPANRNGEELRDVMVWLSVISYAKKRRDMVGFISGDTGFRPAPKDEQLDPALKDELAREGVEVIFAISIDEFVKDQSPARKPVTAEWVAEHLKPEQIEQIKDLFKYGIVNLLQPSPVRPSGTEPVLLFKSGTLYELSAESQFVQLEYEGSWALAVGDPERVFELPEPYTSPPLSITAGQIPPSFLEGVKRGSYESVARPATISLWQPPVNPRGKALSAALATS